MVNNQTVDKSKKVKNIAAVLYLLILVFLVGGSYLHQKSDILDFSENKTDLNVLPQQ